MEIRDELTIDELNHISGGAGAGINGNTGNIYFEIGTKGSSVSWPGSTNGVSGTWTVSSTGGLSFHPA
jgi:bacteriocin-like protein